jgi:hypothetical protein
MKRTLAVVLLSFVIAGASQAPKGHQIPQQNGGQNTALAGSTQQNEQYAASTPSPMVAIYNQPCPPEPLGENKHSQGAMDGERQLAKFTWYLVLVGIVQCVVLLGQGVLFSQQKKIMGQHKVSLEQLATAASDNAVAAKNSAAALINSERSWVMVEVEWPRTAGHLLYVSSGSGNNTQTQVDTNLICVNRGKSPAWIVERIIKAEISGGFYGPDLSTVDDSEIDRQLIPLGIAGMPEARTDLLRKIYAPGTPGNKYILVYGVVRYRDAFTPKGELRETWFGYYTLETRVKDPMARIAQPEYNKYT